MMKQEKREMIIREFERFVQEYSVEYTDYNEEVLKGVLALLNAQKPMKPVFSEEKYGDALDHCPACERALPNGGEYGKSYYCYKCGQAVKWK